MTGTVPDFLQDEFTQEAWDSLTDAEREGMLGDESEEEQQQSEEQQQQQVEADAQREADAISKATADQQATQEDRHHQFQRQVDADRRGQHRHPGRGERGG